jgi:chemotaxis signal transduction protein
MSADVNKTSNREAPERREVLILNVGRRMLGIFTENVAGVAAGKSPVPLPRSPESVLGVVAFRGRMLTVVDLLPLLGESAGTSEPAIIVALSGEEQLAIAADSSRGAIQVFSRELELSAPDGGSGILSGTLNRNGDQIDLLDVPNLFDVVIKAHRERRRRRF